MTYSVSEFIVEYLSKLDIKYVTGIPGSHILPLFNAVASSNMRFIPSRHELSSATIGDAYGRLTGKPMLVIVTAGPGATNTVTGVAQAYGAASPLILISGSVSLNSGPSAFHGVDDPYFLEKIFKPITKFSKIIKSSSQLPKQLAKAVRHSISGRKGPVYIGLPENLLSKRVDIDINRYIVRQRNYPFSQHLLSKLVDLLHNKRIVLVLGAEVFTSIPSREIIKLATSLNSPVICQIEGLGYFPQDHQLYAGYVEEDWDIYPQAINALKNAEVVLFLGLRPGETEYKTIQRYTKAKLVYIGFTRGSYQENLNMSIIGDLQRYISNLSRKLEVGLKWYYHIEKSVEQLIDKSLLIETVNHNINPIWLAKLIGDSIPRDSILCVDIGSHETWARILIGGVKRVRYLYPGNYGSMGFALPAAIGAYLANTDNDSKRDIYVIIGDGGLLMCMEELATISELTANIKIFVFNDSRYGMIYHMQKEFFGKDFASSIPNVDFSKIGEAFGIESTRITHYKDVEPIIKEVVKVKKPVLIDFIVDYKVKYITFK